jgi:hypothetical protein
VTSNINYLSINENFPVAGQDNDTQVFRDNFDTIKTSLRVAKEEITTLQSDSASLVVDNDFNLKLIQRAVFQNNRMKKFLVENGEPITVSPITIDYENGNYQIFKVGADVSFDFLNFPGDPVLAEVSSDTVGKVTIELYGDGSTRTVSFSTSGGTVLKKNSTFPGVLTVTSTTDPVFIEIWRHNSGVIFMNYLGAFL